MVRAAANRKAANGEAWLAATDAGVRGRPGSTGPLPVPSACVPELSGGPATLALLVLSHGAASVMDDVESYYRHILHGRPPQPDRLEALRARYRAIGGSSPLNRLTRLQAAQLAAGLRAAGIRVRPYVGFQHVPPFIGDAVRAIAKDGLATAKVVVMTPYYSPQGVGRYLEEVARTVDACGRPLHMPCVTNWYQEQGFLALLERRIRDALATLAACDADAGAVHVIFTAHSLPVPQQPLDDPYVDQFRATARLVADRLGLPQWSTCFQSASDTGQLWLGPDILEELDRVAEMGSRAVVVCPTSFAADNLEVLYDIGQEAARHARQLGMTFVQTAPFNDDPAFTGFLARMLARRLATSSRFNVQRATTPTEGDADYALSTLHFEP